MDEPHETQATFNSGLGKDLTMLNLLKSKKKKKIIKALNKILLSHSTKCHKEERNITETYLHSLIYWLIPTSHFFLHLSSFGSCGLWLVKVPKYRSQGGLCLPVQMLSEALSTQSLPAWLPESPLPTAPMTTQRVLSLCPISPHPLKQWPLHWFPEQHYHNPFSF